ncbi:MAG: hypothetical protein AMXMBFR34_09360 [Myxococcaceae bacterium]
MELRVARAGGEGCRIEVTAANEKARSSEMFLVRQGGQWRLLAVDSSRDLAAWADWSRSGRRRGRGWSGPAP